MSDFKYLFKVINLGKEIVHCNPNVNLTQVNGTIKYLTLHLFINYLLERGIGMESCGSLFRSENDDASPSVVRSENVVARKSKHLS